MDDEIYVLYWAATQHFPEQFSFTSVHLFYTSFENLFIFNYTKVKNSFEACNLEFF